MNGRSRNTTEMRSDFSPRSGVNRPRDGISRQASAHEIADRQAAPTNSVFHEPRQQQAADRRAQHDAHVGGDAQRRVRLLAIVRRHQVGHHRACRRRRRATTARRSRRSPTGRRACRCRPRAHRGCVRQKKPRPISIIGRRPTRSDRCPPMTPVTIAEPAIAR